MIARYLSCPAEVNAKQWTRREKQTGNRSCKKRGQVSKNASSVCNPRWCGALASKCACNVVAAGSGRGRTRVPYLGLDCLAVDLDAARCKLHSDGALGLEIELVPREPRQEVRLSDPRISDENNCARRRCRRQLPALRSKRAQTLSLPLGPTTATGRPTNFADFALVRGRRREIVRQFKLAQAAHGRMHVCRAPTFEKVVVLIVLARHGWRLSRATHTQPPFLLSGSNVPALSLPSTRQFLSPTRPVSRSDCCILQSTQD